MSAVTAIWKSAGKQNEIMGSSNSATENYAFLLMVPSCGFEGLKVGLHKISDSVWSQTRV